MNGGNFIVSINIHAVACRGVTRLDGARAGSKFGAPMFEVKVFL